MKPGDTMIKTLKRLKKKQKKKVVKTDKISRYVQSIFLSEARDTILLGEIRSALTSPKKRDRFRKRIVRLLFKSEISSRKIAEELTKTKPPWVSETAFTRLKQILASGGNDE